MCTPLCDTPTNAALGSNFTGRVVTVTGDEHG